MGPWSFWYCVRVERSGLWLHARLRALTDFATFDVGVDSLLHLWPPVFPEDQLFRFLDAWVSGRDMIVELGDDFASECVMVQYVDAPIVLQESPFAV